MKIKIRLICAAWFGLCAVLPGLLLTKIISFLLIPGNFVHDYPYFTSVLVASSMTLGFIFAPQICQANKTSEKFSYGVVGGIILCIILVIYTCLEDNLAPCPLCTKGHFLRDFILELYFMLLLTLGTIIRPFLLCSCGVLAIQGFHWIVKKVKH